MEATPQSPQPAQAPQAPVGNGVRPGEVVSETFSIYRDNAGTLLGASAVVFVAVGVISGLLLLLGVVGLLLAFIVEIIAGALFTGAIVQFVLDMRDGRRDMSIGDLFSAATPTIGALIGFGILFGLAVGIGFILIIIPGLILLTIWCLGAPAIVVERQGVMDAFGRSRELVRGNGWNVFGALILIAVISIVINLVIRLVFAAIFSGAAGAIIGSTISSILLAPIGALAVSIMFFDLGGGAGVAQPAEAAPAAAPAQAPPPPEAPPPAPPPGQQL